MHQRRQYYSIKKKKVLPTEEPEPSEKHVEEPDYSEVPFME
ncbi:MAG: hypothetical protein PHP29_07705 [Tissierellia bacterium]|nr:hypothetical protein [Tissierellia bacterium]